MIHRLFGVPEFADALKRYDEVTAERPNEAPVLRVLRRLNDANNRFGPTTGTTCKSTRTRCSPRPSIAIDWASTRLRRTLASAVSKRADITLRTRCWHGSGCRDNRCKLAVRGGFVEDLYRAIAAILEDRPTMVNDLKLEAAAFLCMARRGSARGPALHPARRRIQRADGGWGKLDTPDPANPDGSSWHSTILALLLLLHVEFPERGRRAKTRDGLADPSPLRPA